MSDRRLIMKHLKDKHKLMTRVEAQQRQLQAQQLELQELRGAVASARLTPQVIWFCAHCGRWMEAELSLTENHMGYEYGCQCAACDSAVCPTCETLCQGCEARQRPHGSARFCPACSHHIVDGMCRECAENFSPTKLEVLT